MERLQLLRAKYLKTMKKLAQTKVVWSPQVRDKRMDDGMESGTIKKRKYSTEFDLNHQDFIEKKPIVNSVTNDDPECARARPFVPFQFAEHCKNRFRSEYKLLKLNLFIDIFVHYSYPIQAYHFRCVRTGKS